MQLMQLQHVESLLDRMTQEGVQPNHISYRTAITGCVAAADSAQVSTTADSTLLLSPLLLLLSALLLLL
jgi:hypothetical protein